MKITPASEVLLKPRILQDAATSLTAGQAVSIVPTPGNAADAASNTPHTPELRRHIDAGQNTVATVHLDEATRKALNVPGMAIGATSGALAGASVGIILNQLKQIHPASAPVFDAACAIFGAAIGGAAGSNSLKFSLGFTPKDGAVTLGVEGVKP